MNKKSKEHELVEKFVCDSELKLNKLFIDRSNDIYLKLKNIKNIL